MEWVLSHMEDPGFNDPLEPPAAAEEAAAAAAGPSADPEAVSMLQAMGFTDQQASRLMLRDCATVCAQLCQSQRDST